MKGLVAGEAATTGEPIAVAKQPDTAAPLGTVGVPARAHHATGLRVKEVPLAVVKELTRSAIRLLIEHLREVRAELAVVDLVTLRHKRGYLAVPRIVAAEVGGRQRARRQVLHRFRVRRDPSEKLVRDPQPSASGIVRARVVTFDRVKCRFLFGEDQHGRQFWDLRREKCRTDSLQSFDDDFLAAAENPRNELGSDAQLRERVTNEIEEIVLDRELLSEHRPIGFLFHAVSFTSSSELPFLRISFELRREAGRNIRVSPRQKTPKQGPFCRGETMRRDKVPPRGSIHYHTEKSSGGGAATCQRYRKASPCGTCGIGCEIFSVQHQVLHREGLKKWKQRAHRRPCKCRPRPWS